MYFAKPHKRKFNIALGIEVVKEHIDLIVLAGQFSMH